MLNQHVYGHPVQEQPQYFNPAPQQPYGYQASPQQPYGYQAPPQQPYGYQAPPQQSYGYQAPTQQPYGYQAPPQQPYGNPQTQYTDQAAYSSNLGHQPSPAVTQGVPIYSDATTPGQQKFVTQGYKDVWCSILYLIFFFGVVAFGAYNFSNVSFNDVVVGNMPAPSAVLIMVPVGAACGVVFSLLTIPLFLCMPTACIVIANIVMIMFLIGFGILLIILTDNIYSGIIFFILGILRIFFFYISRHLIPLSASLLKRGAILAKDFPAMTFVNIFYVVIFSVWMITWCGMLYPYVSSHANNDESKSNQASIGVYVLALFTFYWVQQVTSNTVHVIVAGVTATWYFNGMNNMPAHPTFYSTKRAMTTSFGSICLGSLIVAILRLIRQLIYSQANREGFCALILVCIIDCIESLMRLFNEYAFVYCAIYGSSYFQAAKQTMELIKRSAFEGIMSRMLVTTTLLIMAIICGVAVGVGIGVGRRDVVEGVVSGLSALAVTLQLYQVLRSSIIATFVCLAEEPELLRSTCPEMYNEINNVNQQFEGSQQQSTA